MLFVTYFTQYDSFCGYCVLNSVRLSAAPWTVARQAPLSGISLVRMLEQVVLCFSRSSSWPRDQTQCLLPLLNPKVNSLPLHCMGRTDGLWVHPYCYKWHYFIIFYWWIISSCMYVPHLVYPCLYWWTFRVLSGPGCCKQFWNEHLGVCIFSNYGFLSMCIPRMGLLDHMITLFSVF